jgi:hypothetical protein
MLPSDQDSDVWQDALFQLVERHGKCEFCDKPKVSPREQTCGSDECLKRAYGRQP